MFVLVLTRLECGFFLEVGCLEGGLVCRDTLVGGLDAGGISDCLEDGLVAGGMFDSLVGGLDAVG